MDVDMVNEHLTQIRFLKRNPIHAMCKYTNNNTLEAHHLTMGHDNHFRIQLT